MTSSDHSQIVTYLEALAGDADPRSYLELRYRLEDGENMGQIFERPQRTAALATRALALARTTDVYFGCAPRVRRAGGRDAVRKAFVLWVDCDDEDAVDALGRFEPAPSIVIASGTGRNRHAYWPLAEPLQRDDVERANHRLAYALGSDPQSADAARILRPPATLSHKRTPPRVVSALVLDPGRRFSAADVVGGLRDAEGIALPSSKSEHRRQSDDPLLDIAPPVYVSRLLNVEVPRHGKVRCPFHADDTASLHVYKTPARGWYCFGKCRRGGTIYDLAAPLYGFRTRGAEFLLLRSELLKLFSIAEA